MDKKLPETTNLCRNNEKLGGKQRGNLVTRYKFEFAVWLKRDAVQYRKWSLTANDPETANDPQNGP